MKTKNPVIWFEIYVDDINRARKFYENVLEIQLIGMLAPDTIENDVKMVSFPFDDMLGPGASGALVEMKGFKLGGASTIVYFSSDDCAIEEARIVGAGGRVQQSKQSLGEYGFMVLAVDTEGNIFGVHSIK